MFKRIIVFLLSMLLIVPVASADTIAIDLETATADELQAARDAINKRLAEILASDLTAANEALLLKGNGTQLLEGIKLNYSPARLFVKSTAEVKVTLCSDDRNYSYDGSNNSSYQFAYVIENQQSFSSIIVETQGEWTLELSPIGFTDQLSASGSGSFITDCFSVTPPSVVSIEFDAGWYGGYSSIYLNKIYDDYISSETWMWQDIVSDESFDYIIKPEQNVKSYFIQIHCPHDTQWEITIK